MSGGEEIPPGRWGGRASRRRPGGPRLRRAAVAAALALTAAGALAAPAARRAPEQRRIAFLGLRPALEDAAGQTVIAQLAEAQRLRAVAENVVEILSGATVLRHEELRSALGRTYLADLFDCRGEPVCLLRVAAPLARQGVRVALVGDYFGDAGTLRVRARRLDLAGGRVTDEVTFPVQPGAADTLAPWQEGLRPLFQDAGRLRIVANVADARCTLDGRPCAPWPAELLQVEEGEHILELSREGYRRATRVVTVKRGEELRVALALEELPAQVQKPPDPSARLPTFAAPTEETQVTPFGSLRLAVLYDDVSLGELEDVAAPPDGTAREGTVVFYPRPAVLGLGMQAPKSESGWELRGGFGLALARGDLPEFDSAFAELLKPEAGFRLMIGWGAPIVSNLTAGTLTLPEGFGDLAPGMVGVTLSKSFGALLLEGFVGKQKGMFDADPEERAATPLPFGAARVAWVDEEIVGRLYGEDYPFTISVSGIYGRERVGLADPILEDLPVWVASFELFVPFGKVASIAGEGWYGEGAHLFEGALWQEARVDVLTGRHRELRSAGGWAQLVLSGGESFELRLVAGLDRVVDGLDFGPAPDGAPAIRENRLAALAGVWYLLGNLALGAQLHAIETVYHDPLLGSPRALGAALTSRLTF